MFVPIPIGTDCPQRRTPWMNYAIIALNVLIFLASSRMFQGGWNGHAYGENPALRPGWSSLELMGEYPNLLQFLTYQFLHQDFWHILFNMLFLYIFGNKLNEKLGHLGYLSFYLSGGVLAGCAQVLFSDAPTLGASGSVSAVTGLFLVLLPRTRVRLLLWILIFVTVVEIPGMYFILFQLGSELLSPYLNPDTHVAHMAHIAGLLSGVATGFILLWTGLIPRDHFDLLALIQRWNRRRRHRPEPDEGFDPFRPQVVPASDPASDFPGERTEPVLSVKVYGPQTALARDQILTLVRTHDLSEAAKRYQELRRQEPDLIFNAEVQLDLANQMMSEGSHAAASEVYELYLKHYPQAPKREQIELMLGLIYARYVPRPDRARELLTQALIHLSDAGQKQLAANELARLTPPPPTTS